MKTSICYTLVTYSIIRLVFLIKEVFLVFIRLREVLFSFNELTINAVFSVLIFGSWTIAFATQVSMRGLLCQQEYTVHILLHVYYQLSFSPVDVIIMLYPFTLHFAHCFP